MKNFPAFLFFTLLFLLQLSSSYILPQQYFIDCGSDSTVPITLAGRNFIADSSHGSFSVGASEAVVNDAADPSLPLYRTARIYRNPSSFDFKNITENVTYLIRLHFFPFTSHRGINLVDSVFHVWASNFSLLSNFTVRNSHEFPVITDFLLRAKDNTLSIYFAPADGTSVAFVNAIEVFLAPEDFIINDAPRVTSGGSDGVYKGLVSQGLQTVYRVNVGGEEINDSPTVTLGWVPDDEYVVNGGSSVQNCSLYNDRLRYGELKKQPEENVIPDLVYKTCKKVEAGNGVSPNITWRFNVSQNTGLLVRVHFCDTQSSSANMLNFSLYIYGNFRKNINPYANGDLSDTGVPFYYDFVVESDHTGFLNVSISLASDNESTIQTFAYLNGLEIMEFMKESHLALQLTKAKNKKILHIIIPLVSAVCSLFVLMVMVFLGLKWRKGKQVETIISEAMLPYQGGQGGSLYSRVSDRTITSSPVPNLNLKLKISFAEVLEATHNFDSKLLIGEGGFGKVYKGVLKTGKKVAVKRSDSRHGQGLPEFHTEIIVLSKICHRHLVSLIGYCDEGAEMILVYEFMEKGTLRDHLYSSNSNEKKQSALSGLTWKERLEICIGSAKGLHYLHTGSDGGIIHRDVKSTNILLDENYVAKVADFGLSRSGPPDPDDFSMGIKGSFGYLDPEYFTSFQFTEKSDVYSFGVVLLEVLCARPAIITSSKIQEVNLADWGLFWHKKGQLEKIIDPLLVDHINPNSLRIFGEVVEKCLRANGADRPTMLDVLWDLEYALQMQQNKVRREPHEDSTMDASFELGLPVVGRLASINFPFEKDDKEEDGDSEITASAVFSQLKIEGAR